MSELLMQEAGLIEGLDTGNEESLNGRRIMRFKGIKKPANVASVVAGAQLVNPTSRTELTKRLGTVSKNIQDGLMNGSRQSVDTHFMIIKPIAGQKSVRVFDYSDDKTVGFCQIHQGQLQKEEVMVLTSLTILMGTHTEAITTPEAAAAAKWEEIGTFLKNGTMEFKADNKSIIPEMSCEVFGGSVSVIDAVNGIGFSHGNGNKPVGLYRLDNPKMLPTQTALDLQLNWGITAPNFTALKVILHGSRIYKK